MAMWTVASAVQGARGAGQDRVVTDGDGPRWLLVLADGAGGSGGGASAAEAVVAGVAGRFTDRTRRPASALEIEDCLTGCDRAPLGGETTAVVVVVDGNDVRGASVGDSEAWLVNRRTGDVRVLTEFQVRKPLLGRSEAIVTAFVATASVDDLLLIGSDGLFKYIARANLLALVAAMTDLVALPAALIAAVRLPSGGLQDDVSVIVAACGAGE
ncbi:MAG TPA: SpoIIE family protein phosphatase [Kofleriaceae bacterium]|nr:SpoIIE family protein phosphatase [Kofleriaceae bacterium]